jgi:hypothetical protein
MDNLHRGILQYKAMSGQDYAARRASIVPTSENRTPDVNSAFSYFTKSAGISGNVSATFPHSV